MVDVESRTMQGVWNPPCDGFHVKDRPAWLVEQLQADITDHESIRQLVELVPYMDTQVLVDAGAIELLLALLRYYDDDGFEKGYERPFFGAVYVLHYLACDSAVLCDRYTDRIAEAGAIPRLFRILEGEEELRRSHTRIQVAEVLEALAKRHEVDFNSIERLISLIRDGTSYTMYGYKVNSNEAAYMLYYLVRLNPGPGAENRREEKKKLDKQRAIIEANGFYSQLVALEGWGGHRVLASGAALLLTLFHHPTTASQEASQVCALESENTALKAELARVKDREERSFQESITRLEWLLDRADAWKPHAHSEGVIAFGFGLGALRGRATNLTDATLDPRLRPILDAALDVGRRGIGEADVGQTIYVMKNNKRGVHTDSRNIGRSSVFLV